MDSFYEDDAEVIKAWKNYAAAFGITAFYHSPDDPLPHAEIKGAVLLGGKLTTKLISYQSDYDLITEQETQLYQRSQRENTEKELKEQCVDSDVDNNSSFVKGFVKGQGEPICHLAPSCTVGIEKF